MSDKIKTLQLMAIAFTILLLNVMFFYMQNCSRETIYSKDVFETEYSFTAQENAIQLSLIATLPDDMKEAQTVLQDKITELDEIYHAALFVSGEYYAIDYWPENIPNSELAQNARQMYEAYALANSYETPEEAIADLQKQLDYHKTLLANIEYILGYHNYVATVAENAEQLIQMPIYNESSYLQNNIIKTQRDFYGLNNVNLNLSIENGYMTVLNYRISDCFALLLTIITIALLASAKTNSNKKLLYILVWCIGIIAIYGVNYALADYFLGLPDFNTALQSLMPFKSCPYLISCGLLLLICILLKMMGYSVILSLGLFIASAYDKKKEDAGFLMKSKKGYISLSCIGFLVLELAVFFYKGENSILIFLREINFFSAFGAERFFLRYFNLNIFGQAVSALPIFVVFMVTLTIVLVITARNRYLAYQKIIIAETERYYYDEINRRYNETRKIHHDIDNHLLTLRLLIENGNLNSAKTYIGEISEKLDLSIIPVKTGSNILDALICQKTKQAQEQSVEIKTEIYSPLGSCGISDYDLCGIFGNILDNAIRGAASTDTPLINLFIGRQMNMLIISCKNPYQEPLRRRGDKFLTTKKNPSVHGLGLERVREITASYGGEVKITADNGQFLIEILLNINTKE